jgi:hypothetical protein
MNLEKELSFIEQLYCSHPSSPDIRKNEACYKFIEKNFNSWFKSYSARDIDFFSKQKFGNNKGEAGIFLTYMVNNSKTNFFIFDEMRLNYFGFNLKKNKRILIKNNYSDYVAFAKMDGAITIENNNGARAGFLLNKGGILNIKANYDPTLGLGANPLLINVFSNYYKTESATVLSYYKNSPSIEELIFFAKKIISEPCQELMIMDISKLIESAYVSQKDAAIKSELFKLSAEIIGKMAYKNKFTLYL